VVTRRVLALACVAACEASFGQPIAGPDTSAGTMAEDMGNTGTDGPQRDSEGVPGPDSAAIGWAGVAGQGQAGTFGGEGGRTIVVTDAQTFAEAAAEPGPVDIVVVGTIEGIVAVTADHKTIRGEPGATLRGSLVLAGTAERPLVDILVRDLNVIGTACADGCADTDAITVRWAHHVWIDHCDIANGDDGNLDITRESDYLTVSWCRFSYDVEAGGDRLSNLIGADDAETADADHLRVTLHHNWWSTGVVAYMPRVRFGRVHVFDNFYDSAEADYCIRAGWEADVRIENNAFSGIAEPLHQPPDRTAKILVSGNTASPRPLADFVQGSVFLPPYPYELEPAEQIPELVMAGAGPR
jgi:pectate lyase